MAKSKVQLPEGSDVRIVVGGTYLFDDVTSKLWLGRVLEITGPHGVILEDAAWVADTGGRLHLFVRNGGCDGMEIEPVGVKAVHWAGWIAWRHPLIISQYPEA